MTFFSIIVPIYNVQAYLRECLTSVLDQDFEDFEIVVVDDRSPDHSGAILDEMALVDARIRALHLDENVGLGRARNAGVAAATGDYVLFLDGDDTFAPGSLRAIADKLQRTQCPQILIYNYSRVWWDGHQAVSWGAELLASLSAGVFRPQDHRRLFNLLPIACNKAYRRDFLESLSLAFRTGLYEDISWTYTVLLNATTAASLNRVVLLYRQRRSGSILGTTSPKHFDVFAQYDLVFDEVDRLGIVDGMRKHLYDIMINHYVTILRHKGRLAPSDLRPFFAQSAISARGHLPPAEPNESQNLPSNIRGRLFREGSFWKFSVYSRVDLLRAPARRFVGRIYWPARRTVRKLHALRRVGYRIARLYPVDPNLVVFSEYWGTGFGCNPRAIFEALPSTAPHLKAVWIIDPKQGTSLPPGTAQVPPNSLRQFIVLARGKYFVNNVNFTGSYVKRPGQVHVQTLHGTPLKYCGLDVMGRSVASSAVDPRRLAPRRDGQVVATDEARNQQEFAGMLTRSDRWDFALSSNAYSTEMWGHAYPCSYTWLEVGYPRNDVLVRASPEDTMRSRELLGVRADQTAVLYAPTYRDVAGETSLRIDFVDLLDKAPDDFVFIVRAHHTTVLSPRVRELVAAGRIIDGSAFSSIVDCYLAADVLVTDYSSVMFDYANLGRPIIIYADDWDDYQNARGTYFDLLAAPPGAVARSQEEFVTIIRERTFEGPAAQAALAAFRSKFCAFDDGHAAENVIRRVMIPR